MFLDRIERALSEISAKLDILIKEGRLDSFDQSGGTEEREKEKRNEKELQEGIDNLMSYDPFRKKRSGDE